MDAMHLQPAHVQQALPAGWECAIDAATGHWYYFNRATSQTSWVPPQAPAYTTSAADCPDTAGPHAAPGSGAAALSAASGGALMPAALGTPPAAVALPSQPTPYAAAATTTAAAPTAPIEGAAPSAAAVVTAGASPGASGCVASGAAKRPMVVAPVGGAGPPRTTTTTGGSGSGWYYRDRAGRLQGPFHQNHLHAWRAFLPMDLLVWYVEVTPTRAAQQPPAPQLQQQQVPQVRLPQVAGGALGEELGAACQVEAKLVGAGERTGSGSPGRSEAARRCGEVGAAEAEQEAEQGHQQEQQQGHQQEAEQGHQQEAEQGHQQEQQQGHQQEQRRRAAAREAAREGTSDRGGEEGRGSREGWTAGLLGLEGYGDGAAELHGEEHEAGAGGSGGSGRGLEAPPRSPLAPSSAAAAAANGASGPHPDGTGQGDDDRAPLGRSPKRARTDAGAGRVPFAVETSTPAGTAAAGPVSTAEGAARAGIKGRGADAPSRSASPSPAPGTGPGSTDGPTGQSAAEGPSCAEEAIACGLPGIELAELLGDGPILADWRRRFPGHRHNGTAPPAPVHDHWLHAAAAAAASAYMHSAEPYGRAGVGVGAGAVPVAAAASGSDGSAAAASRPRSREESMLEYAEAVLAVLPPDDEAVVLARQAAAAGKTLADVVNFSWGAVSGSAPSGGGGGVYDNAVDGTAAALTNEYGTPTEYVRDPRSGRLTAVGVSGGGAASASAAKALYGEYGSWVDPDQIEDYLAKAKRWRQEQLPQLWARTKLKEQREAKAKRAARAAAAL